MNKNIYYFFKKNLFEVLLLSFLIIGLIISVSQLSKPINAEADVYCRVLYAIDIKKNPVLLTKQYGVWLPMHPILLTLSLFFYDNYFLSPRIITLIFSLATLIALYFYSQLLEKNKKVGILASLLYLFFPLRIFLSTLPLTESIFNFFMITSMYLLLKKKPNYSIGLILLNISQAIRYEAWFILPIIWCIFLANKKLRIIEKLRLIIFSLIFPIIWFYSNFVNSQGDPLFFVNAKIAFARMGYLPAYGNILVSFNVWKTSLLNIFPSILIILTIFGIVFLLSKKLSLKKYFVLFLPLYLFLLLVIQTYLGTMEWFPSRYLFLILTLCFPLIAKTLLIIYSRLKTSTVGICLYFSIIFLLIFWQYPSLLNNTKKKLQDFPIRTNNYKEIVVLSIKNKSETISYYYSEKTRFWQEEKISYFSGKKILTYPKSKLITNYQNNNSTLLIIEKDDSQIENFLYRSLSPVAENALFILFNTENESFKK